MQNKVRTAARIVDHPARGNNRQAGHGLAAAAEVPVGRAFTKPFDVNEVVRAVDAMVDRRG